MSNWHQEVIDNEHEYLLEDDYGVVLQEEEYPRIDEGWEPLFRQEWFTGSEEEMFGFPFAWNPEAVQTKPKPDPDADSKREAMALIEKDGRGICEFCGEEIIKTEYTQHWTWESEFLLGYCPEGGAQHKHKPLLKYSVEKGAHNAE